jgi:hypothetical protein
MTLFSGFGPFGSVPHGGTGLPPAVDSPSLEGSQKSATAKNTGLTGLNRVHYDPTGYDPEIGAVNGARLCGHDAIFGPYKQTRFLGASITSFSSSIGLNNGSSSLDVTLVEDNCYGDTRYTYCTHKEVNDDGSVGTDHLLMYNRTLLHETNDVNPDSFNPPKVGTPVYFRMQSFEYCGLLSSWQKLQSSNGMPTYSVKLTDPREILDGVQVILSEERSDFVAKNDGEVGRDGEAQNLWNVWNVFQFLEDQGKACNKKNKNSSDYSRDFCYGGSKGNDTGVEWNKIRQGLQVFGAGTKHTARSGKTIDFSRNNYGIRLKDAKFFLDIEELPEVNNLRINGPVSSVLDIIGTVCEFTRRDFWVELLPVKDYDAYTYVGKGDDDGDLDDPDRDTISINNLPQGTSIGPGEGIALFIKIRTISRDQQPKTDAIENFIDAYQSSGLVIDSARGLELINEPTNVALLGGPQRDIYQCEEPYEALDELNDQFLQHGIIYNPDGTVRTLQTYEHAIKEFESELKDVGSIHVGAAERAIGGRFPKGIQPFWGFHANGDLIIGSEAPNPYRARQVLNKDGDKVPIEGATGYAKILHPKDTYTIKVSAKELFPKLFLGKLCERELSYDDVKDREWGSEGDRIYVYPITSMEMRAAKSGFTEWKALIATHEQHPVTMTYKLNSLAGFSQKFLRVLSKAATDKGIGGKTSNLSASPLHKLLETTTGLIDALNKTDAEKEEKRQSDLDLRTIHEFVLSYANKAGREFLVPLFPNPKYNNNVKTWELEVDTRTTVDPYYGSSGGTKLGEVILTGAGKGYGHYSANLCSYEDEESKKDFPTSKIIDRGVVSSQPSMYDPHPFAGKDTEEDQSIIMLPHPAATAFFQDDVGLVQGFCRFSIYADGKKVAKLENINDRDLFYNANLYSDTSSSPLQSSGVWVKSSYSISSSFADTENNIAFINKHYQLGPYAVASLPSAVLKEEASADVPKLLRLLLLILTTTTQQKDDEDKGVTFNDEVIQEIQKELNLSQGSFGFADDFLYPEAFAVPLESRIYRYGPFLSEPTGIAGPTKVFDESNEFVPWNFGSVASMGVAASGLANERVANAEFAEIGSLRVPGLPSGATLGFEVEMIGNARGALVWDVDAEGNELPARHVEDHELVIATGVGGVASDACLDGIVYYSTIAQGNDLEDGEYPVLDGSRGPQVSDISVSVGEGGVTTNYQFRTFTKKNSEQLSKFNLDKIRREGLDGLKGTVASLKARLNETFSSQGGAGDKFSTSAAAGDVSRPLELTGSQTDLTLDAGIVRASRTVDLIAGISNTTPILRDTTSTDEDEKLIQDASQVEVTIINSRAVDTEALNDEDGEDAKKAFMSMDGLVRPVSIKGEGGLPAYYKSLSPHCTAGTDEHADDEAAEELVYYDKNAEYDGTTSYYSSRPHPPIVGSGLEAGSPPSSRDPHLNIPTGIYHGDYSININFLNPFTNSDGNKNVHPSDTESEYIGHDITLLASSDNPKLKTRGELEIEQLEKEEEIHESYQEDYRAMALRGPLLIHGWGYDLEGKPIPNYKDWEDDDTLDTAKGGEFAKEDLTDYFAPGWLKKSGSWPVAPLDLRFDRDRGVWVSPQTFKFVTCQLKEAIPNDDLGYSSPAQIRDADMAKDIYDDKGNVIPEEKRFILVNSDLQKKYAKDEIVRVYYDEDECEYRILSGSSDPSTFEQCLPTLAMLTEDLLPPTACNQDNSVGTAFKLFVDEVGQEYAISSDGVQTFAKDIDILNFTAHLDTNITLTNSLRQPIEKGSKIMATNCFHKASGVPGDSPGDPATISVKEAETEFYRVVQAEFCPMVVLTSIYIREDYPCDLDAVYSTFLTGKTEKGICGTKAATAGGGVEICNKYASTQVALGIDHCPDVPDPVCVFPPYCAYTALPNCCIGYYPPVPPPSPPEVYCPLDAHPNKAGKKVPPGFDPAVWCYDYDWPEPPDCPGYCLWYSWELWDALIHGDGPFSDLPEWVRHNCVVDCPSYEQWCLIWDECVSNDVGKSCPHPNDDDTQCAAATEADLQKLKNVIMDSCTAHEYLDNHINLEDLRPYLCHALCKCEKTPPVCGWGDAGMFMGASANSAENECGSCLWIDMEYIDSLMNEGTCYMGPNDTAWPTEEEGGGNVYLIEAGCADNASSSCVVPDGSNCIALEGGDLQKAYDWIETWCCVDASQQEYCELLPSDIDFSDLQNALCRVKCDCDAVHPCPPPYFGQTVPTVTAGDGITEIDSDYYDPGGPTTGSAPIITTLPTIHYLYANAKTDFCFDMDVKVRYPTYPELRIDVGERVIYLQSMWSNPMYTKDRAGLGLDVAGANSNVPDIERQLPVMPVFGVRKTDHWWEVKPNEKVDESMLNSYAAGYELNANLMNEADDKQVKLNIDGFGGFDKQKIVGGEGSVGGAFTCCESYAEQKPEQLLQEGRGNKLGKECGKE